MAYNLDSPSKCSLDDLKQAVKLVPSNLKPYLEGFLFLINYFFTALNIFFLFKLITCFKFMNLF